MCIQAKPEQSESVTENLQVKVEQWGVCTKQHTWK
jgi:hypothetical protein